MSAAVTDPAATPCRVSLLLAVLAAGLVLGRPAVGMAGGMQGPPGNERRPRPPAAAAVISPQALLDSIRFFQTWISPLDGSRCQFTPTCSVFGHRAIRDHGPWLGVLMTTDRLMRCNYWTDAAAYPHLPGGRLADPVAANLGGE